MSPALPLSGLTVVEMGSSVAAPFGAQVLAELGATVVKIENPQGGDDARLWGPPVFEGASTTFCALNRNKLSAAVDLKDAAQLTGLRRFILEQADVVLQNMRSGVVERLGLDAITLQAAKPSLIYCNLSAFGTAGPLCGKPGYDPMMQAFGGIMSFTGEEGREPVRVGPSIIDQGAGMWAVIGILAALHRRDATGEGTVIDTSLYETALGWTTVQAATFLASGRVPRRIGSENAGIAPYKAYRAADDAWLVIAAGNDGLFRRLAGVLGHPEWADDPQFRTNPDRVANREQLNQLVAETVATAACAEWLARFDAADLPAAPVLSLDQVLAHPQSQAVAMLQPAPDGGLPLLGIPLQFDGVRPPYRSPPPSLGRDTAALQSIDRRAGE